MNKNLFFDIQLGASGDMLVGALLDIEPNSGKLTEMLSKIQLNNWIMTPQKTVKHGISGTSANITCKDDIHHRNLNDIRTIIKNNGLPESITDNIINIFGNLAKAEAKVHGKKPDEIHFHEIGAIDSIIDISAFCILINILGINKIFYNTFHLGTGTIKSGHGEIPVPVPAVVELIKNHKSRITDKAGELVTPTAAAILTTLGSQIMPGDFTILANGTGFGTREHNFPSYTRAFITEEMSSYETIQQIECNIDDMNPQLYPNILEMLLEAGALDAYTCAVSMKKGRPGTLLVVIANNENVQHLREIIYNHTTTLGIRVFYVNRDRLERKYEKVSVKGEEIRIKIGYLNNKKINFQPEFEDCREAAAKLNLPLKEVIAEAVHQYKINNK
jgi:pyridinium-3,5-bisthiocarboxylic acid mononucleotide nickel chelatase